MTENADAQSPDSSGSNQSEAVARWGPAKNRSWPGPATRYARSSGIDGNGHGAAAC